MPTSKRPVCAIKAEQAIRLVAAKVMALVNMVCIRLTQPTMPCSRYCRPTKATRAISYSLAGLIVSKWLQLLSAVHLPLIELVLGLQGEVVLAIWPWARGQEMVFHDMGSKMDSPTASSRLLHHQALLLRSAVRQHHSHDVQA